MRPNKIRRMMSGGERVLNAWLAIPSSYSAEVMAHQGWDSVTIDLQHGPIDFQTAVTMLQAISTTDATPMVRAPWNDPAILMKLLDAGAYGVICPMINTAAEAAAFVSSCRYCPQGVRSFGPNRAVQYAGADYWQHANEEVLLLAMIETREAIENLDRILDVPGLDGVYIGPSDLSLSLGKTPTLDPQDREVLAAMATILTKVRAAGKFAGAHTDTARTALRRFEEGFQFCSVLGDARLLAAAAAAVVREVKGAPAATAPKTY